MRTKRFYIITLLLIGLLFLSACVTENPAESTKEPTAPAETGVPYPDPGEVITRPTDSAEPYPDPNEVIVVNPYPGVDDPNRISDPNTVLITDGISPISSDKNFNSGPVFIESADIVLKESFPVQVELVLTGNLPTPCHQLRVVVSEPDADSQIEVQAYSVSDPEKMCIQVLEPFEAVIPLGDYTKGEFTILINEEPAGEFHLP